jgi:hypothetical protein
MEGKGHTQENITLLVNPVRKLGYNTEIRSSSPDGPEKILVLFL